MRPLKALLCIFGPASIGAISTACSDGPVSAVVAVDSLVYVTPEQAGFSSTALAEVEE